MLDTSAAPAAPAAPKQTQEDLILKQFAAARQKLGVARKQGQEEADMQSDRAKAITGLSGGAAIKAQQKAQNKFNESYSQADADLEAQQAGQLRQAKSETEQKEFQASQADIDRSIQQKQFGDSLSLQTRQFEESKNQFKQQMQYQWTEYNENVKTNLLNAAAALKKAGINSAADAAKYLTAVNLFRS